MNANVWIIIGILCVAVSAFAIPYGFYLKSIQIESLQGSHGLSWEEEMAYKGLVTQIFNELKPHAKVHINDVIKGIDSNKNHKVDISIRSKVGDQEILTIEALAKLLKTQFCHFDQREKSLFLLPERFLTSFGMT